ncbi:MAG: hypothetical protein HZA20_06305 [Nitrospirae bacterium]|nr:hypothetical protein [Nitrospirota bacterium]
MSNQSGFAWIRVLAFFTFLLVTGCASSQRVTTIGSNWHPDTGASATVYDSEGVIVASVVTPFKLDSKHISMASGKESFRIVITDKNLSTIDLKIEKRLNGWFADDAPLGGFNGYLVVDPRSGSTWTLIPEDVVCVIPEMSGPFDPAVKGFVVMDANDMSPDLRQHLIALKDMSSPGMDYATVQNKNLAYDLNTTHQR